MIKKALLCSAICAALVGCGSSRDSADEIDNSEGIASISGEAVVGQTLTASIADDDGVESGTDSYQWFADGVQIEGAASSSYTLTAEEDGAEITVVIRYTDNSGFRETDESDPTVVVLGAFNIGATFIYGPVDGATCNIFAVDSAGMASATAAAMGTTSGGLVDFGSLIPIDGTGLIECTGGTYIDEATGNMLNAPDTRAIVTVGADTTFTVSPLTEIAAQRAEAEGDLNTAITTHNTTVSVLFGLSGDITEIEPTDLSTTAAGDDDAGAYAMALALLSQLDANDTDSSAGDIVDDLAEDLADGTFSESTLDDISTAQTDLASSPVADNLNDAVLQEVVDAISNTPEPATFEGLSATIPNDQEAALTGTVIVTDPNFGEALIIAQTDADTTYGIFTIAEDGAWSYTLDTTDAAVVALEVGASINDIIPIQSADGTAANLVIRITAVTQVAVITNTINGDTGELRLNLENHLLEGKLTFSFLKTEALGDDGNEKDAYITLYGSSGSSAESLVDLRIQGEAEEDDGSIREPRFLVRNTDSDSYPGNLITAPFTPNQWYDVEITWDVTQAGQEVTISIDGEVIGGGAFQSAAIVDSDCGADYRTNCLPEGVERVQWRFGDNGTTIPFGSYFVDNVVIYSDAAGTLIEFEDDFEGNNVGEVLGAAPYASDSVDAEVTTFILADSTEPTPAAFFNLTGAIFSDDAEVLMGMVTVIDPDAGEDMVVGQTDIATTYGNFSIFPAGMWEYTLDTANETIAALVQGDRETDSITITSIDGTTAELVITINGVGGGDDAANNVAVIVDTTSDTGELRYALDSDGPLAAGRLEAKVKRLDDDLGDGDAFITLFNENTNNDGAILDLRIRDSSFGFRNPSATDTSALSVVLDQFMDVVITWEYPGGDTTLAPQVTVEVDGAIVGPVTPDNNPFNGVTHVAFRFGDNSGVIPDTGRFTVDDIAIYSDTAGTVEVFSDDFESYLDGDSLDDDNPSSPYNSSTADATVETVGGPSTNAVAVIVDTTSDTGELRYALDSDGPLAAGRLEAKVKRLDDDLGDGDAFITLFNENTNNDGAILDLRIRDSSFGFRNPSATDTSALSVVLDQFMDVVITWEYPGGDTTLAPQVTVEVDGAIVGPVTPDNNPFNGVTHVAFRFGDNSGVIPDTGRFTVDDIAIYSDTAGTVEVFSDDFESYLDGDSLDDDNPSSPYNSSTADATVETVGGPSTNAVAVIVDTTSDTGELRYALDSDGPLAAGRLEAKVKRLDDDLGDGDAFITLFNENTNNDGAILDLRIRDSSFGFRNPSATDTSALSVVLDQFMDVVITWEYPGGDTTLAPQVTVEVDGAIVGPVTPDNNPFNGVTHVAFRFGDNSGVIPDTGRFTVDDIAIYSDTAGTVEVFSDDFESYLDGDSLDDDNPSSPYNSSTADATVEVTGGDDTGSTGNQIAVITDTSDADTGELRLDLDAALLQGKISVNVNKEATQDGFINLSGDSTTRSNAMIDIRINDSNGYEFTESGATVNTNANFPVFANDTWVEVEITWDADVAGAPEVTVTIDGQAVTDAAFPSEGTLANIMGGVQTVQFRLGGGSAFDDTGAGFAIDNLSVYSDIAGTVLVFNDDFESYTLGNSLDPNADTASSGPIPDAVIEPNTPYKDNSFQITVEAE